MGAGRPTDYREEYNEQVFRLCLLGATDKEVAVFFNVDERTINNWKEAHEEFFQSIKKGKIEADAKVAESLYKRAIGFSFDEITFEKVDSKEGMEFDEEIGLIKSDLYKKKVVTKLIVGDVAAQNIWLKNRRAKSKVDEGAQHWADKQEHGLTDNNGDDLKNLPISFE